MLHTVGVVQARMGSQRFPGKSLMPLAGRPMLQMLLERLNGCTELDALVVATSVEKGDDPIAILADQMDVACVRGSESDVLARFVQASSENPSQAVVRICADNPLTDPALVDSLVGYFREQDGDYAYNNRSECGFPDGVGVEIIATKVLQQIADRAELVEHREHVTSYIFDHPDEFRISGMEAPSSLRRPEFRLDIDYPEDLEFLTQLCALLPEDSAPLWQTKQVIEVLDAQPALLNLRAMRD